MVQSVISGLFNSCKADVLATLYWFAVNSKQSLTINELQEASMSNLKYLRLRLPVYAGKAADKNTKKLWQPGRLLVKRHPVERNGRLCFAYQITNYGKQWINGLPKDNLSEIVTRLRPKWLKLMVKGT